MLNKYSAIAIKRICGNSKAHKKPKKNSLGNAFQKKKKEKGTNAFQNKIKTKEQMPSKIKKTKEQMLSKIK